MTRNTLTGRNAGHRIRTMISEEDLQARIAALGAQITEDYAGKQLIVLGVLKGSFLFMADLVREIDIPLSVEFLGVSSYAGGTETTGEVKVTLDLRDPIAGRHVLVAEDIVDTGLTLDYVLRMLKNRNPASLKLCCLLDKPERRRVHIEPDYVGFSIPNQFVVGYGLDIDELYRNLPYIGVVEQDAP